MKKLLFSIISALLAITPAFALTKDSPAPSFSLRKSDGNFFYFTDYIGPNKKSDTKGIIISFFASYCEPCKRELPLLNDLVDELRKKGIEIVIVGFKEDFDKINNMLDSLHVDKPIILSDTYGTTGQKYGVTRLPMMFLIGADSKVKDIINGELTSKKTLREKCNKFLR